MILRNDKQLGEARKLLARLQAAAEDADTDLDRFGLNARAEEVYNAIRRYVSLRDGEPEVLSFEDDGLCDVLIMARVAQGLTQAELAERIGVSQQQVQKDEAGAYQRASLGRILDVIDALEYRIEGRLVPLVDTDGGGERALDGVAGESSSYVMVSLVGGASQIRCSTSAVDVSWTR